MAGTFDALPWARKLQLPAAEKALMFSLCSYLDENNQCFPSQSTLASDSGLGERTVRRYLRVWERSGMIDRRSRARTERRGRTSDLITLHVGKPIDLPARAAAWKSEDLPAKSDDLPAADDRTYRPIAGQGTTKELPVRTAADPVNNPEPICPRCKCSTDRPGSFRRKRQDVVCTHEVSA